MGFEWLPKKNYKRHYICLQCQKGFKRPSKKDMKNAELPDFSNLMNDFYASEEQNIIKYIKAAHNKLKVTCPNCKDDMLQVHYDFEVPKQRDSKSWKTLQETLADKLIINYSVYSQWHILALKKEDNKSHKYRVLQQNLKILEEI